MAACGATTSAIVTGDGELFTFGRGGDGKLGLGDSRGRWEPAQVKWWGGAREKTRSGDRDKNQARQRKWESRSPVLMVSTGMYHSAMVTEDGQCFCWGRNNHGQLGTHDIASRHLPERVHFADGRLRVKFVSCGGKHTIALVHKSLADCHHDRASAVAVEVYAWGRLPDKDALEPVRLEYFSGLFVTMVACGASHTAAVSSEGRVYTWGLGADGRLGHGDTDSLSSPRPIRERSFRGRSVVIIAACGASNSACVDEEGRMYTWGANTCGALGIGAIETRCAARSYPCQVDAFKPGVKILGVALGSRHAACVARDGDVYTWGSGQHGQLGHGTWESLTSKGRPLDKALPELIDLRDLRRCALQVSCGDAHTAVVTRVGKVYTFGCGSAGRLGVGDKRNRVTPQRLGGIFESRRVGRYWGLSQEKKIAFLMASHARLGSRCEAARLGVPGELLRVILEAVTVSQEAADGLELICHIVGGTFEV